MAGDPVGVLQALAAYHRNRFDVPVIGITGSNGKTIVKDWLVQLLSTKYRVCSSPRSFNSQIGVPLSVWQLRDEHEIAVFEAGVSRAGEMGKLAEIIRPTHGVFTMLGAAHAEGFASEEEKRREKLSLFTTAGAVVLPPDDRTSRAILTGMGVVHCDREASETVPVKLPRVYRDNAAAVVTASRLFGISEATIQDELPAFTVLQNRLEQTAGRHGAPIINDSYSNDIDALAAAVDHASGQSPSGKIHLILGTLQNPATSPVPGTRDRALSSVVQGRVATLTLVGPSWRGLAPAAHHFASPERLLAALPELTFEPLPILVKGASYEHLDRVARALSRKQHRTDLHVDLGAIQRNLRTYKGLVDAKMIVMVKASAYGGGSLPIARAVTEAGADYLAVAYVDEGKELRRGGLRLPILVLNPELEEFSELAKFGLEPVAGNLAQLKAAKQHGLTVHLEIDTGMARLGFAPDEIGGLTKTDLPTIASVFSHLVASEAPEKDGFTRRQYQVFQAAYKTLIAEIGYRPMRHLANSNAISRAPYLAMDAVRLGIGLYGVGDRQLVNQLRPVLRLTTRIAGVKRHPAGTTIGYNRRGVLHRESTIATLSIGYADGLPRSVGNGKFGVTINGRVAPIVGDVCMDMTMVDVTDASEVSVGAEVEIFGPNQPLAALAEAAGTIGYEILTGIGPRVHRIYSRE